MRVVEYPINVNVANPTNKVLISILGGIQILSVKAKGNKPTLFVLVNTKSSVVVNFTIYLYRNFEEMNDVPLAFLGTIMLPETIHVFQDGIYQLGGVRVYEKSIG